MKKDMIIKEIVIILVIFLLSVLIKIPLIDYISTGDEATYLKLSQSLYYNGTYEVNGEPHKKYLPLFPLVGSFFIEHFPDQHIMKIINIVSSAFLCIVLYIFLRYLKISIMKSFLYSLITMFNPWFFYYTGAFGISEGLAGLLLVLSIIALYIYLKKDSNLFIALSGFFLGLATLTRITMLSFGIIVIIYLLIKKKFKALFLYSFLFLFLNITWFIRGLFIRSVEFGYLDYIIKSIVSYPFGILYFFILVFPLSLLLFSYYYYKSVRTALKQKNEFIIIVTLGIILHTLISILGWDLINHIHLINNPWSINMSINFSELTTVLFATRYFVTLMPLITIIVALRNYFNKKRLFCYLLILVLFSVIYSYGSIQNEVSLFIPIPNTYVQKMDAAKELSSWYITNDINSSLSSSDNDISYYFFLKGINIINLTESPDLSISDKYCINPVYSTNGYNKYYICRN
jgi:hypothetical protein